MSRKSSKTRKTAKRASKAPKAAKRKRARSKASRASTRPQCGLCGATKNLTKTECCDQWICDDEHEYVLFSYDRNSCSRNHSRYTLCGYHFNEGHPGHWKDCEECREQIEPEMYVEFGTNEYNFEVLEHPPEFEPTKCAKCGAVIVLADGGYSHGPDGYKCGACTAAEFPDLFG